METASWVTAIATVVYSIAVIVTLLLIKRQIAEGGRLRESGVVEEAYKPSFSNKAYDKRLYREHGVELGSTLSNALQHTCFV